MRAKPDGFELTFTEPVDPATAADPKSYKLSTYTYIYQAAYGSPEVDATDAGDHEDRGRPGRQAACASSSTSSRKATSTSCTATASAPPPASRCLHPQAYYTLNYIPEG